MYIHSVGFCIAYSNYRVFLGPQTTDKQQKESAFFILSVMKQIVIIGARGYGRVVCNIAKECIKSDAEFAIKGFLDNNKCALDGYHGYPPILSSVEDYVVQEDDVFVCAMGAVKYKQIYASMILNKGGKFINI
ncbi:MAG: hypothetical protein J6V89_05215, partial [Acetobacter sp.]|nr:hypothetical protein [Acetobacter sp.]